MMLNQHPDHAAPLTDWLQVGDCVVDIPRREVASPHAAQPARITLKAQQVLLVLVNHHGKVISREALLELVWPDTMPTDDVLTQAIAQLRKAFGDDRDAPRYLETIAKGGYRLLAPIRWNDSAGEDRGSEPADDPVPVMVRSVQEVRPKRKSAAPIALATIAGVAVVVAAFVFLRDASPPGDAERTGNAYATASAPIAFETITSRPGRETMPSVSPDGSMVAYSESPESGQGAAIMVQATTQAPPRRLTPSEPGISDIMPVWSHDGRRLAFLRLAHQRCRIMLIAASGGEAREVADCYGGMLSMYDWTPDDSGLVMGGARKAGERSAPLRVLDLTTGRWRSLDYDIADGDTDINPHYSPDGKWIVFRRNVSLSDLWKMPAAGGKPQRLTHVSGDIRGWDWLPDGSGLVFCLVKNDVGLYRYRMADGRIERIPVKGDRDFLMPDVAARAERVVGELEMLTTGIYRQPIGDAATGGAGEGGEAAQLFASSGDDLLAAVSPDGRMLAFISDRSLRPRMWLATIDRPESLRPVDGLDPVPRHAPVWSRDGRRLLAIGTRAGRQALYEIEAGSDVVRALPVPGGQPTYVAYTDRRDRLLVGTDGGSGKLRLGLYDTAGSAWRQLARIDDVSLAKFDHARGRVYFTRASRPGLWWTDPELREIHAVPTALPTLPRYRDWAITDRGVYFLASEKGCDTLWRNLEDDEAPRVCLNRSRRGTAPSVPASGDWLAMGMAISDNVDVGWLSLSPDTIGQPRAATVRSP